MSKTAPIDINRRPLASGFFSSKTIQDAENKEGSTVAPAESIPSSSKNKGGRPRKEKKKAQYTLTMDPELYNNLRKKAEEKQMSFSQLITNVMIDFLQND